MSAITKIEYEKLPKIGSLKEASEKYSDCIVPLIENKNDKVKDESARKFTNAIPDDLLLSLKQAEQPKEYMGPPSKKTLNAIKPTNPSVIRKPDNAWNFEKQRERLKFLTDQPICSCGAGKDISFLYDSITQAKANFKPPNPSKYDLSAIRAPETSSEQKVQIPDTLIPDEFKIVKNQGVWPLKFEENQYTAITDEHLNHVTTFPSLKPVGRNEVIQLKHTMDALLKRVGADVIDLKGPTQLHNLLEIIKQEQDIYNIIFHEVIRQVTIECKERGEILSKLRERYANLLSRVPREIKSLHEEIVAQRALDRRLTEELLQFKSTIAYLTDELSYVKEHDRKIAEQASIYQKDLEKALKESEKNASLLNEYHELYELQRKRLESNIKSLIEERDLWIKTSYSISSKVTFENKLNSAKRLNISEKAWSKLAKHLALLQSDHDTKDLIEMQKMIESWKQILNELKSDIIQRETDLKKTINWTRKELVEFKKKFRPDNFDENGHLIMVPDYQKKIQLNIHLKNILELTSKESENFSSDSVSGMEEKLKKCERFLFLIVQLCMKLLNRHESSKEKEKQNEIMRYEVLQAEIKILHEQYRNRATGDNGVLKNLNHLNNILDVWYHKLSTQISNDSSKSIPIISESEWISFYQSIDDCIDYSFKTENRVGHAIREISDILPASDQSEKPKIIDHDDIINDLNKWMSTFNHFVDSQDSYMIEEVHIIHNKMIHWMVQALVRLAPDKEEISEEAKKIIYETTSTVETLEKISHVIGEKLDKFSNILADRCNVIITDDENNRKPNEESRFEKEFQNISNLKHEVKEWNYIVKLLLSELNGDKLHRKSVSDRIGHVSNTSSSDIKEKKSLTVLAEDEQEEEDEENIGEEKDQSKQENYDPVFEDEVKNVTKQENSKSEKAESKIQSPSFEIIAKDTNTELKFLENLGLDDSNHLSEQELKSTVFNAFKTIESLQNDLIATEERAQKSEEKVSELELQLKEALERIRSLEKK